MTLTSCAQEKEIRELLASGQAPVMWPPELHAHLTGCRTCGDLVLVSRAFNHARTRSLAAARPIPPAILMWRAQLRRRNAAVERMGRPLLGAQIFAFAVILSAALGFAGFEARSGAEWATWSYWYDWFAQLPHAMAAQWGNLNSGSLTGSPWSWMVLASVAATVALLAGVAVYFATDKQ